MAKILALDIGATKIAAGIVQNRRVLKFHKEPTNAQKGKAHFARTVEKIITKYGKGVSAVGIGVAGQVDQKNEVFLGGPNFPKQFKNLRLLKIARDTLRVPVKIDNDAHCFALAEASLGAGKKYKLVYGITLGTGIGGGIVLDGKIVHGAKNTAAEVGHMVLDFPTAAGSRGRGVRCSCGRFGHLEAYASGRGMTRRYKKFSGRSINAKELEELYKNGNKYSEYIVRDAAEALAAGIANILITANPDCIVLGGGLSNFKKYVSLALGGVRPLLPFAHLQKTPILVSRLREKAGVIGASLL